MTSTAFPALARTGWRLLATALLAFGLCGVVAAQSTNNTITFSTEKVYTYADTTLQTLRIDTYHTRLIGLLQGDPTLYYDQTFAFPFADAAVQAGLLAAQEALDAASPDPLNFLPPALLDSFSTLLNSQTVTHVLGIPQSADETAGPETLPVSLTVTLEDTIGGIPEGGSTNPIVLTGDRSICVVLVDDVYWPDSTCAGSDPIPFEVIAGTANVNFNFHYDYLFTRESQTTETWDLFQTWSITGVPLDAQVPEPGALALVALGLGLLGRQLKHRRRAG